MEGSFNIKYRNILYLNNWFAYSLKIFQLYIEPFYYIDFCILMQTIIGI